MNLQQYKNTVCLAIMLVSGISVFSQTNTFPTNANVGIGTTSPGTTLQVNGTTSLGDAYDPNLYGLVQVTRPSNPADNKFHLSFIRSGSGVSGMGYVPNSNSLGIWVNTNNSFTPAITLTTDQRVGLGIVSPHSMLHVHHAPITPNTIAGISEIASFSGNSGNLSMFKFLLKRHQLNGDWTHVSSRLQAVTDLTHQGYIEFNPPGDPYGIAIGTYSGEFMRFKENGFIGINTANPRERLQIGDRFVLADGGWKAIGYNFGWDYNQFINTRIVAAPMSGVFFTDIGNIILQTAPAGAAGSPLNDAHHTMIIHNSGQVGIGTNFTMAGFQDLNNKLMVEGGIRARKVKVDIASWPDYVFDSAYHLRPLKEVESFIQQHKHLPEISSATEVEKEGLDLGSNQAALLKKVEELTLYIIGQEKKMEKQEKEIETLKKQMQELIKSTPHNN